MSFITCPDCTTVNLFYKQRCEVCFKHLHNPEWRCNSCLYLSPVSVLNCSKCNKHRTIQKTGSIARDRRSRSAERYSHDKVDENQEEKSEKEQNKNLLNVAVDTKHKRPCSADNRLTSRWKCCQCTFLNGVDDNEFCEICDHVKDACCNDVKINQWMCYKCENLNEEPFTRCSFCEKRRLKAEPKYSEDDQKRNSAWRRGAIRKKSNQNDTKFNINKEKQRPATFISYLNEGEGVPPFSQNEKEQNKKQGRVKSETFISYLDNQEEVLDLSTQCQDDKYAIGETKKKEQDDMKYANKGGKSKIEFPSAENHAKRTKQYLNAVTGQKDQDGDDGLKIKPFIDRKGQQFLKESEIGKKKGDISDENEIGKLPDEGKRRLHTAINFSKKGDDSEIIQSFNEIKRKLEQKGIGPNKQGKQYEAMDDLNKTRSQDQIVTKIFTERDQIRLDIKKNGKNNWKNEEQKKKKQPVEEKDDNDFNKFIAKHKISLDEDEDEKWSCKRCSLSNHGDGMKCRRCDHDKPMITGSDFDNVQRFKNRKHDIKRSIRAKNLRTIKTKQVEKEWKNIVRDCKRKQKNFVDNSFPPNDSSLYKHPSSLGSGIKWKRLKDIMDEQGKGQIDWKVYDNPTANDIVQGEIGNCWFICALAVIAERQELLERIIVTKDYCPEGAYVVRLCKDGTWKTVVVDDYFPVDQWNRLKYSKAKRGQLWVPLIEKAAAKIHGCYDALRSGRTVESLDLLTGEPCEHMSLTDNKDLSKTVNDTIVWSKLLHARNCRYLMCTSCGVKGGYSFEHYKSLGLINEHAYSLLDVYEMDTGERLLKIRNPWGTESWNGDWNDDSRQWRYVKQEVKDKLKPDGNKHGVFWMEFKDFRNYFGDVDICKIRDWHETRVKGSFPKTADGPWIFAKVYVPEVTDLCLGLHQKNKRGNHVNEEFVDMFIMVTEILDNRKQRTVGNSKRHTKSFVGCEIENLKSGEYIISCLAFKHLNRGNNYQLDFILTIHSTESIVVEENDSVAAGYTHFLADTLIQLAIDKGDHKSLSFNNTSYTLPWNGMIYVVENFDKKKYTGFQQDCTSSSNLMSSRGSAFTQDIIPPAHRQVLIVLSTINPQLGYSRNQSMSYISDNRKTLEYFGNKKRQHNPDIPKELECLHLPRPIR